MNITVKKGLRLPIRTSPVRFAVLHENGLSSNSWIVQADKSGEVYVICRDNFREVKASLHKSGQTRIAFTEESGAVMPGGSRVWNEWVHSPLDKSTPIIPLLEILFPDWSLNIPYSRRSSDASWSKVQCFVETGHDCLLTLISLHLISDRTTVRHDGETNYPIGLLPMGQGLSLLIVANRVPESNWRQVIENSIRSIDPKEIGVSAPEEDGTLVLLLSGYYKDGTGFMLSTPVDVRKER